jgi:transposase
VLDPLYAFSPTEEAKGKEMNMIKRMMMDIRGAKGLTQAEVAERAGIDKVTLSRWVRGVASPQGEKYRRFFEVYSSVMEGAEANGDVDADVSADVRVGIGRDKAIANMHRRGYLHREIAEIFGLTKERVRQIVKSEGEEPRRRGAKDSTAAQAVSDEDQPTQ